MVSARLQQVAREAARLVGTTITGRYVVRSILGVGGNGVVFEAEDIVLRRHVAIKIPTRPRSFGPSALRFRREARAGASVAHANVCALYDFGLLPDGAPFIVMERLVGETLAARLAREGTLPLRLAIQLMQQVLAGLAAAHVRGIVHRDMKPGNIFLTKLSQSVPRAQILDFGSSALIGPEPAEEDVTELLTAYGTAVGTPYYMSPEQVCGDRDFDPRADIFACGVILYEATVGRRPFDGQNLKETFRRIMRASPVPASSVNPDLPPILDEVLARAMVANRERRYPSAAAFSAALSTLTPPVGSPAEAPAEPADSRLAHLQARFRELAVLHRQAAQRESVVAATPDRPSITAEVPSLDSDGVAMTRRVPSLAADDDPQGTAPTKPRWEGQSARGGSHGRERVLRRRRR
jgi:serine/threonine protein kinase